MREEIKTEELNGMGLLKLIYEEIKNTKTELNEKIKHLDEKIDNTKNILVLEIAEELKDFSRMLERTTNNLNQKIDNEIEDRKIDVSKIKEFNKIIINDIRGRVSILEEESEKYNLK